MNTLSLGAGHLKSETLPVQSATMDLIDVTDATTALPELSSLRLRTILAPFDFSDISAELVVISNDKRALALAQTPNAIPNDVPEWLTPLVNILPAQLFAYHLTVAKGYNTEQPRSIRKVTETK